MQLHAVPGAAMPSLASTVDLSSMVACLVPSRRVSHPVLCSTPSSPLPQVDIDSVEKFEALREQERAYFVDMVQRCKDSGAGLVICQWGFDDEANHLLMHHGLPA